MFKNHSLVDDWKSAYKWASVRLAVLVGAIVTYATTYPDEFAQLIEHLPGGVKPFIPILAMVIPIYLRITQKDSTKT